MTTPTTTTYTGLDAAYAFFNPSHFREHTAEHSLSTLVHEMVYLRQ